MLLGMLKRLAVCALLLGPSVHAAKKPHNWTTGVLLEEGEKRQAAGFRTKDKEPDTLYTPESGNVYGSAISSDAVPSSTSAGSVTYRTFERYVIDDGATVYEAEEPLRWHKSKPAHLALKSPVKFYIEEKRLYLLDAEGREHQAAIVKQTARANPGS